ncbi:hypothetical protein, partial [Sphingomonas sp. 66-10]|uniref:hypothetical protein n=1 Tax=Sphingomonas sp. 66-10 TaxID=1895848 RepID=UPI00257C1842
ELKDVLRTPPPINKRLPPDGYEPARGERIVSPSVVELCLAQGRRLRFDSGIEGATLTRLIRSVEAA